jgi:ParB family chromosome partitioning protein
MSKTTPAEEVVEVTEVRVKDIKVRFRLRTPSDVKVDGIKESISMVGLLNPLTIDADKNLLAGYHRLLAFKALKRETIPCIIKAVDKRFGELCEIDENLARHSLSYCVEAVHIHRREQLMRELGLTYERGDNRFTASEDKLSVTDLAEGIGFSRRQYQMRKQLMNIPEEIRDLLISAGKDDSLTDLVKLSNEPESIQRKVCDLLITGKNKTWKMAFFQAKYSDFRLKSTPKFDFDFKERWGEFPKSIMKFSKVDNDLRKVCNLVNHDEQLRVKKGSLRFGETPIALHQMNPEQAVFALDYYTNEGDLICDPFNGRGTTAITSLHLNRRFVGWEINPESHQKTSEVLSNNVDADADDWHLHLSCGCQMKEYADKEEVFDGVFTSPPYYLKAEKYNDIPEDLCNMKLDAFRDKIDELFGNLSRLIKTSNYEDKIFHPIIMVLGTARDRENGIIDMAFDFQEIARRHNLKLWDQQFIEIHNPQVWTSFQRNYEMRFVCKNYESQLVWVKF